MPGRVSRLLNPPQCMKLCTGGLRIVQSRLGSLSRDPATTMEHSSSMDPVPRAHR